MGVAEALDENDRRAGAALRPEQSRPAVFCVSHGPIVPDECINLPPTSSVQRAGGKETPRRYPKFSREGDESDGCAVRYARRLTGARRRTVIILGIILLVVGFLLGIPILWTLGVILVVIGLILVVLGSVGHAVGGRRHYF